MTSHRQALVLGAASCAALGVITIGAVGRKLLTLSFSSSDPIVRAVSDPLPLSLIWVGLLLLVAGGLGRGSRVAIWGAVLMAILNVIQLLWYQRQWKRLGLYDEFKAFPVRMSFLLAESAMLIAAANLPALTTWWKDWRRPDLAPLLRLSVVLSATLWAVAVRLWTMVLFERGSSMADMLRLSWGILPALPLLFLAIRFLWAPRARPTDARWTRIAGWFSLVCLILILITPVAYGLIGIYLLMSPAGVFILAVMVSATVGLLMAGSTLRDRSRKGTER